MLQPMVILALGVLLSCGGGGESSSPPPPPGNAIQVSVQPSQAHQTWEAWRGVLTGPIFIDNTGTERNAPPSVLSSAVIDLADDLGFNGVRYNLHHNQDIELVNDNLDPFSINWAGFDFARSFQPDVGAPTVDPVERMKQMILPLRQRVLSHGEPFSMYITLGYTKSGFAGMPAFWLSDPREYAEMAQAFILWIQQKSPNPPGFTAVTPNYWVIDNEPTNSGFTPAEIAALISAVGSRFASMGVSTKIQTTETVSPNPTFLNGVLAAPNVSQYVGLITFHGYDYTTSPMPGSFTARNQTRDAAQSLSASQGRTIHTGMTEICCHTGWGDGSYGYALAWARDIYWNMTEGDVSVWEPFGLLNPCTTLGCTGIGNQSPVLLDADLSRTVKLPQYYSLRQFSHFIRPGYRRVSANCSGCSMDATLGQNVKPVAFQSPAGKFVVVIINDQSGTQSVTLNGLPAGTYDITGVDPAHGLSPVTYTAQTIGAGQAVSLTFPAQAIVTFAQR